MTDLSHFREKLTTRLKELHERLDEVEDQLDDPHDPDFAEQAVEREQDEVLESLGAASEKEINLVENALARIEDGSFGICMKCGENISEERLEAVPHATLCRNCAK